MIISADTLYKLRRVRRLSQAEMGKICGVTESFINRIESGSRNVTDRVRHNVIRNMGLTPDKLAYYLDTYELTAMN
ncbi:helix-turn-helix domain-containing protein [Paenibacillus sp. GCM10027627]|uniref:helix-turn-helix domain-containing protein n=1 Tax=unclassified Paenibacillus TaxID=185978 RepID=UPI003633BC0E